MYYKEFGILEPKHFRLVMDYFSFYVVSIRSTIDHFFGAVRVCLQLNQFLCAGMCQFYFMITLRIEWMDGIWNVTFALIMKPYTKHKYLYNIYFLLIFRVHLFVEGEIGFYVRSRRQSNSFDCGMLGARVNNSSAIPKSIKQIIFFGA